MPTDNNFPAGLSRMAVTGGRKQSEISGENPLVQLKLPFPKRQPSSTTESVPQKNGAQVLEDMGILEISYHTWTSNHGVAVRGKYHLSRSARKSVILYPAKISHSAKQVWGNV